MGTVLTRSPESDIASIAMKDFNIAIGLFERTTLSGCKRAKIALVGFSFFCFVG